MTQARYICARSFGARGSLYFVLRRAILLLSIVILSGCMSFGEPLPLASPSPAVTQPPADGGDTPAGRTAMPPAPTASATPAATATPTAPATPLQPETLLATYFFYWHECPEVRCDPQTVPVVPPGWREPLAEGGFISTGNPAWFEREVRQLTAAGIQVVLPVSWGGHYPDKAFRTPVLAGLVEANAAQGAPLRIGMFDDTTSQMAEFGDYLEDGRVDGSSWIVTPTLSLARPESGFFFYDRKIKPFFELVPREQWALIDGRPLIVVYSAGCCLDLQYAGALWQAVKQAFIRDFGVEPWLVLEDTWFNPLSLAPPEGLPSTADVADGRYAWGAAANGLQTRSLGEFSTAAVGPGMDNRQAPGVSEERYLVRERREGAAFAADLAAIPAHTDLVLIETWNEWWEGTSIAPAPYPSDRGGTLPETFYIDILRHWRFGE